MKKITAVALAIAMLLSMCAYASAEGETGIPVEGGNIYFDPSSGAITNADDTVAAAIIPSSVDGIAVTAIGLGAFAYSEKLSAVIIPEGVTSIGENAFLMCRSLLSPPLPDSLTHIGSNAFMMCKSIDTIVVPNGVVEIEVGAFMNSGLVSAVLPEGITEIKYALFSGCDYLQEVYIPAGVTRIEENAFFSCESLTDIYYGGSEEDWQAVEILERNNDKLLNAYIHYNSSGAGTERTEPSETPLPATVDARYSNMNFVVDGSNVSLEVYEINGNNYFKLRDLAMLVSGTEKQFNVIWNESTRSIDLVSNAPYSPVGGELAEGSGSNREGKLNASPIYKDGVSVTLAAYTIGGNNYFKLRDLCRAFDIGVTWDETNWTVGIDTSVGYTD